MIFASLIFSRKLKLFGGVCEVSVVLTYVKGMEKLFFSEKIFFVCLPIIEKKSPE